MWNGWRQEVTQKSKTGTFTYCTAESSRNQVSTGLFAKILTTIPLGGDLQEKVQPHFANMWQIENSPTSALASESQTVCYRKLTSSSWFTFWQGCVKLAGGSMFESNMRLFSPSQAVRIPEVWQKTLDSHPRQVADLVPEYPHQWGWFETRNRLHWGERFEAKDMQLPWIVPRCHEKVKIFKKQLK